jgi:hypothetical protein
MAAIKIYLDDNDHTIIGDATGFNTTKGTQTAQSGLTLTGFLCTTKDGTTPIHASLSVSLTEIGGTARYYGVLDGTDLATHLATYLGETIYERITGAGVNVYTAVRVLASRPAET